MHVSFTVYFICIINVFICFIVLAYFDSHENISTHRDLHILNFVTQCQECHDDTLCYHSKEEKPFSFLSRLAVDTFSALPRAGCFQ